MTDSNTASFMANYNNASTRHYSLLLMLYAISIGVFCAIAFQQIRFTSESQAYIFGSTLAAQTASQTTDSLASNDRLSLNVLLNQLSENPYIAAVNIYSIDNKLIAGREFSNGDQSYMFTAPVHYQEVIAGYVRIRLNSNYIDKPAQDAITLILLSAFLLLVVVALIIRFLHKQSQKPERQLLMILKDCDPDAIARQAAIETGILQQIYQQLAIILPAPEQTSSSSHPEEENENDKEITTDTDVMAVLCVRLNNQSTLQQCMNPTDFTELLNAQIKALGQAARLYNGELQYSAEGQAYLLFPATYNQDHLFSATCCALLLERLGASRKLQQQPAFTLGLGMSFQQNAQPQDEHPLLNATATSCAYTLALHDHRNGVAITPDIAQRLSDEPRVVIEEHPQEHIYRITQVHSNYQHLLEQQCRQISHFDSATTAD